MDKIIPYLKSIKVLPGFHLELLYTDGAKGVVDLSVFRGKGVFEYWNDESNFSKVYISGSGAIAWSSDIEIDALSCYLKITNQTFEEFIQG